MRRTPRALPASLALAFVLLTPAACGFGDPAPEELPAVYGMFPLSSTSAAVQAEVVRAHHAFDMSREDIAFEHAQAVIELDPLYAYGYLLAAWSAPSFDDYRANLRRAIENSAGANDIERALIEAEQKSFDGDPEGALEIERRLVATDSANPLFHLVVAQRLGGLNRVEDARAAARRAIELAPDYAGAMTLLGVSYTIVQPTDYAEAERLLRRAIELEPTEPVLHDYLGDLHRVQGRLDDALAGYTRAYELDSTSATSGAFIGQRAHVRSFMGDYAAARADYLLAVTRDAEQAPWWIKQAGLTYLYEGDLDAAFEQFEIALAVTDTMQFASALDQRIALLWDMLIVNGHHGRIDEARAVFDRIVPLIRARADEVGTPEFLAGMNATIANNEGRLAMWRGDYETARGRAREAMELRSDIRNPRRNERTHELLGHIDLREGNFAQAVAHFEQGDPDDVYPMYHHALALEGAGRTAEAMELFRRVAEFRFSNAGTALVKPAAQARVAQVAAAN